MMGQQTFPGSGRWGAADVVLRSSCNLGREEKTGDLSDGSFNGFPLTRDVYLYVIRHVLSTKFDFKDSASF